MAACSELSAITRIGDALGGFFQSKTADLVIERKTALSRSGVA
jgi:hypothetical protein